MAAEDFESLGLGQHFRNMRAIGEAHDDAVNYGAGWLKVDELGNLIRVNPKDITVIHNNRG